MKSKFKIFNNLNSIKIVEPLQKEKRVLKDLNPRHLILETSVLPTELRTLITYYNSNIIKLQEIKHNLNYIRKLI